MTDEQKNQFNSLIERMRQDEKRYHKLLNSPQNDDERRIQELCQKLWDRQCIGPDGQDHAHHPTEFDANRYLDEIEELLDRNKW